MNLLILSLFFSLTVYTTFAYSKSGKIQGYVIDLNGKPISNLHVIIDRTNLGDLTDEKGYFLVENIPAATYDVKFDHIGFNTKIIKSITVQKDRIFNFGKITLEQKVLTLRGVVITATRSNQQTFDVSQPINVISENTIKQRHAKTSAEALREEAGVFIQKTNHGGGSAIIRGLSSNQILILVDGIRLNNSTYRLGNHQYLTTVDHHIVRQIEVVRGPTSVLYGSDALGGTINLITQKPYLKNNNFNLNYRILGRYASADNEKTIRSEFSIHNHKIALQTGFSIKDYEDLRRGKNSDYPQLEKSTNDQKQSPSGFKAYDFDSKLVYSPTAFQTLILAYQMSKQKNVPRYDKYENNNYFRWFYQPQNRDLVYLLYENSLQTKFVTSCRAALSFHRQQEGRQIQQKVASLLTKEIDDVRTLGLTLQFNSLYKQHLLTYGAELYFDKVYSKRFFIDSETNTTAQDLRGRYPNGAEYSSIGFFLQDEIHFSQRLTMTAGLRFSYFFTEFKLPLDSTAVFNLENVNQNFQSVTGSVGGIFKLSDQIFLNLNAGQAFRAPNLSDISKLGESKGNTYEVPNTNLEPEKMISFDVGFKLNFDRLTANASAYHVKICDLLSSADVVYYGASILEIDGTVYKIKQKNNIGNAYIQGFEAALNFNLYKHLSLFSNITATYGHNTTSDEPAGGIPPTFGLLGLFWQTETYFIETNLRFATKQNRLSADDMDDPRIPLGGTPGWQTYNLRAGINILKFYSLQFAVENIFDYNYREHGSGINGPGRNFIVSLELKK